MEISCVTYKLSIRDNMSKKKKKNYPEKKIMLIVNIELYIDREIESEF